MLRSILKNQLYIKSILSSDDKGIRKLVKDGKLKNFKANEFDELEHYCKILNPIEVATKKVKSSFLKEFKTKYFYSISRFLKNMNYFPPITVLA